MSTLSGLANLETLELWHNEIEDFSPLAALTGLTRLDISDNKLTDEDLLIVEGLTNLEELLLGENQLSDLTPFASGDLGKLELLYLWSCEIQDLTPLSGLTNVKVLYQPEAPCSP